MNIRKRKNVIIIVLFGLLLIMGVGYAILSRVLVINTSGKIKGNWDIYIESVRPYSINGSAESVESKVDIDKITAVVGADLYKKDDSVKYEIVVKNNGTINAELTSATLVPKKTNKYIKFSLDNITNRVLKSGEMLTLYITIEFYDPNDTFNTFDETITALTELQLDFNQKSIEQSKANAKYIEEKEVTTLLTETVGDSVTYTYKSDGSLAFTGIGIMNFETLDGTSKTKNIPMLNIFKKYFISKGVSLPDDIFDEEENPIYEMAFNAMRGAIDFDSWWYDSQNSSYVVGHNDIKSAVDSFTKITSITIQDGITSIDDSTFDTVYTNCDVVIPNSITSIGERAFSGRFNKIELPTNTAFTTLNLNIFRSSTINTLVIPNNVTTIIIDEDFTVTNVQVLGDSTRFDSSWSTYFGNATKIN